MLTDQQKNLLKEITTEEEQRKQAYFEREKAGIGHTKYVVLHPRCLEVSHDSIWAGETYNKEEARRIFYEVWGHSSGSPMVHPSGNHYVYPKNYENQILDWLAEENSCYHWSADFQRGRFSR